jgi:hypothetical protein
MKVYDAKKLLKASYRKTRKNVGDYEIDHSLSGNRVQVYKHRLSGEAFVVHRGTANNKDWLTNAGMAIGYENGKRFKNGKKLQRRAEAKYGQNNVITLGHSLGGRIAEKVHKGENKVITVNKAATPRSILRTTPKNQIDIRGSNDLVSRLSNFQKHNNDQIITQSKSKNPIKAHMLSTLNPIINRSV